jgi:hypothetical protein
MRETGDYPSGTITSVLSVHCARRHLARLTGFERVLTILKFEDEFAFDDQDVSIEPVSVEQLKVVTVIDTPTTSRIANFINIVAALTCQ